MKAEPASARGDVELVVNLDTLHVDGIAVAQKAFADSHVVAAGLRLDAGGVTLRAHLPGKPIGPAAMFAARKPGPALGKFLGGAASVMRVHVAPSVLLMGFRGAPPPVIELASQLTGDFLIFGRGRGPVAGVLIAQVKDGGAASKALQAMCQPVGELQLSWHDGVCAAVPPDLSSDLKLGPLPTFDLRVAGDQLVYTIGSDAHEAPGTAADVAGSPEAREIIEGDVTYAAWARGLDLFAALPPEAVAALGADDPELRTGLEVTSAVLAGIYEAGFAVAVRDDGLHILGRVTGFGGDPAPARQAMDAAMTLRLHGDLAGYRAAVVKAGADNPGTLVARQAQLVKDGYPVLGVGVAVVAAVAIPPFMKYIRKAKTSEAEVNVRRMNEGLRAYAAAHDGALPPSAPMTPKAGSCCAQPGQKCAADPAAWQLPAWQALRFSVDDPHYYSYELVTSGSAFTARAMGDLDCDGVFSTFELTGTVQADGSVIGGAGLFKDRELE
jgi:type II secretory pathway pseudopilin PulG